VSGGSEKKRTGISWNSPSVLMDGAEFKSKEPNFFKKVAPGVRKLFPEKASILKLRVFKERDSGFIC
jgi:hypothetical protein